MRNTLKKDDLTFFPLDFFSGYGLDFFSASLDKIPMAMFKHAPEALIDLMLKLINCSLETGHIPESWKKSEIRMILKPGKNRHLAGSYRPISLICSISKIMEKLIFKRLSAFVESNDILSKMQWGFRPGKSCSDCLFQLGSSISKAMDTNSAASIVCLDISKAFDTVWHRKLLDSICLAGVDRRTVEWITNFMSDRKSFVKYGRFCSEFLTLKRGVPQGSVLSPLLFNIYLRDFPEPPTCRTDTLIYADDILLSDISRDPAISEKRLESYLKQITAWCLKKGLCLAKDKCGVIRICGGKRTLAKKPKEISLAKNESVKYLGTVFDSKGQFAENTMNVRRRCPNKSYYV